MANGEYDLDSFTMDNMSPEQPETPYADIQISEDQMQMLDELDPSILAKYLSDKGYQVAEAAPEMPPEGEMPPEEGEGEAAVLGDLSDLME